MTQELPFEPFPFLQDPHYQTILSSLLGRGSPEPPSTQKLVLLPDGDRLSLEITTPKSWKAHLPTVLLVHGLCGSHRSTYLVRMAKRLALAGIRAIRINMRGCGSGRGLAKQFYHSGRSEDVLEVVKVIKKEDPISPLILIGYSLGANIVLKLAGELQDSDLLNKVIAVSPPVYLHTSVQLFDKPENAVFERRFSRELRAHVIELDGLFIPKKLKVIEFDELFTAPRCGFSSALDYYSKCSSAPFVPKIALPCKILFAEDDPLISHSALDNTTLPHNVQIFKTKRGGHLGFLGNPFQKGGFRWLDSLLASWVIDI